MKDTIYFTHDYNAHSDPKIIKVIMNYGREGYGLYRASLEIMREHADIIIEQCELNAIAFRLHYELKKYEEVISFFVEVGLFVYDEEEKVFYSERLQENVEFMREKSKKASQSAQARRKKREKKNANALQSQNERNAIKERKGKEKKGKESKSDAIASEDLKVLKSKKIESEKKSSPKKKGRSEEKMIAVIDGIDELKKCAEKNGIAYKNTDEKQFMAHILYAKAFQEHCTKLNMNPLEYAKRIMLASIKIEYLKGGVAGGPKDIYQRHEDIFNAARKMKEKQISSTGGTVAKPPTNNLSSENEQ